MVLTELQTAFLTSVKPPAIWQLTVGQEMAADIDAFQDAGCAGLGFVMIPEGALEPGTSQMRGGSKYMRQTIVIGVLRCAPTIGDDLRSPTSAEHSAYANLVLDDQERLYDTVLAVSDFGWITEEDISDPTWQAIPVEGGIGGGMITFEMAVISDCP